MVTNVFIRTSVIVFYIQYYSFFQWGYLQCYYLLQTWCIIFFSVPIFIALLFSELLCSLGTMPPLLPHAYKFKYFFSSKNFEVGGPFVIPTSDKASSFHGPTLPSPPPFFSNYSFDPSNETHIKMCPCLLVGLLLVLKMINPSNLS
jgi:hypothetical protein